MSVIYDISRYAVLKQKGTLISNHKGITALGEAFIRHGWRDDFKNQKLLLHKKLRFIHTYFVSVFTFFLRCLYF